MTSEEIYKTVKERVDARSEDVILRALQVLACESRKSNSHIHCQYVGKLNEYVNHKLRLHRLTKSMFYENQDFYFYSRSSILWNKILNLVTTFVDESVIRSKNLDFISAGMPQHYLKNYSENECFKELLPEQQKFIISALVISDEMANQGLNSGFAMKDRIRELIFANANFENTLKNKIQTLKAEKDSLKITLSEAPENIFMIDVVDKIFPD